MRRVFRMFVLVALAVLGSFAFGQSGWNRYRVYVRDARAAQVLTDSSVGLFSEQVQVGTTDVYIGPNEMYKLWALGMPFKWVSSLPRPDAWAPLANEDGSDYRNEYFNMDSILSFYEGIRAQYPWMVSRRAIGTTINGETTYAYAIFNQVVQEVPIPPKNIVFTFGVHAREWISPAVGMHVFKKLAETLVTEESAFTLRLTDKVGVWFVPVQNPDGYRYTWNNNRMWRKNRRNNGNNVFGVDLNRNYEKAWGGQGSSGTPSSETYRGTAPWSEPETRNVRDHVLGVAGVWGGLPNVAAYIDFHSYGQDILWAWSYTTAAPPDAALLAQVGNAMRAGIIAGGGPAYTAGQGSTTLYIASGTSKDWFYDRYRVPSYTIELRDTGQSGFLLPPAQITPTQDDGWNAFVKLVEQVSP